MNNINLIDKYTRRTNRVRLKLKKGSRKRKIVVYRTNKFIWAQIVDMLTGETMVSYSSKVLQKEKTYKKIDKKTQAFQTGENLAKLAKKKNIKNVLFDKGKYAYHGRVKALAEGARKGGLKF